MFHKALFISLVLASAVFADTGLLLGHEAGANGDRVTAWFAASGRFLIADFRKREAAAKKPVVPGFSADDFDRVITTQLVLVTKVNRAMLTNQFGEVKDVRLVKETRSNKPVLLLDGDTLQKLYDAKTPDYRLVLHAYLLAAEKDDDDYKISSKVELPEPTKLLADGSHPFTEPGFDPELHAGDYIHIVCGGEATVDAIAYLGEHERYWGSDYVSSNFPLRGSAQFHLTTDAGQTIDELIELDQSVIKGDWFRLGSKFTGTDFNAENFSADHAYAFVSPMRITRGLKCTVTKLNPEEPRPLVGSFYWKYVAQNSRRLHFLANDEKYYDSRDYEVSGNDGALTLIRPLIGKNVRIHGIARGDKLEVDDKTLSPETGIALCNIRRKFSYTYEATTSDGGCFGSLSCGTREVVDSYYTHDRVFASQADAQQYADTVCAWWNAHSRHSGGPGTIETAASAFRECEAICK